MPRGASARRYAQAVFELASEKGETDRWLEDLALLSGSLENRQFAEFLDAPQVPEDRKVQVIKDSLGKSVNPLALNLISLLASRGSAYLLPAITETYQEMLDEHRGIERAEVVSAVSLNDEQRQSVADMLTRMVGKEIRLNTRVEPQILGGFVARVGDRVIDGSAMTRLEEMRRAMVRRA
jgi:F-type H+-transporting ATPase subunit delta